jgi:hypothetical protein
MIRVAIFLALASVSNAYSLREGVSPVQKVVQLMQDMAAKGRQAKQDEEVKFAAYKQFCEGTAAEKQRNIEDGNSEIEELQAGIQKAESDASVLAEDIAGLDQDLAGWADGMKNLEANRKRDRGDFEVTLKDYEESLSALERAIVVLKKRSADTKQGFLQEDGQSFLQEVAKIQRIPASARRTIWSFLSLASKQDPLSVSAPQANAYEFQSGGVVEMLEDLKDKFTEEKSTLEQDEMKGKHAFDMMMMELKDSTEQGESQRAKKAKTKAQREEDAAEGKGNLADTTSARDEDQKYLEDLNAQCVQKSNDFEQRQQLRAEELEAIQKAISIIQSPEVSGASQKHLGLAQSFALRASQPTDPAKQNVVAYLQGRANKLQSHMLEMLAAQVSADPFAKVKKMIDSMITRLLEEANEEADHKGWCDKEMSVNKQTRDDKTEEVNSLSAEKDKLSAEILKLTQNIADLTDGIAQIDAAVAEATDVREKEKAKNADTIEDAKDAQTAVEQALAVLKEFYKKAGKATAFVQGPEDDAPETFDEPYQGMGGASGGVIGMMEVIQSDFSRLEAETTAAEADAAKSFDRFQAESRKDKAVKTADLDHKEKSKTQKESDLQDTEKDLAGTQDELDAALVYYEKLKPSCVATVEPYEERVEKREAEIESLRMALQILSGDAIA